MELAKLQSLFEDWEIRSYSTQAEVDLEAFQSRKIFVLVDELPSTRVLVQSWSKDQLSGFEECLVVAKKQTAGQGRKERSWFASESSSVTFNYLCDYSPELSPGLLSLLAAWAQYKIFSDLYQVVELDLKWPNDILLRGLKCSGSLMESLSTNHGQKLSLGLGINVGEMEFPEELEEIATSLCIGHPDVPNCEQVLHDVVLCFSEGLKRLNQPEWLLEDYRQASSYVKGALLEFEENGKRQEGQSAGLSDRGGLWIQNERGVMKEYYGSEIQKVRKQ